MTSGLRLAAGSIAVLALVCGCGGGGSSDPGAPSSDDLGFLAVLNFNFEDVAGIRRDLRPEIEFNGPLSVASVGPHSIWIFADPDNDPTTDPPCDPLDGDEPHEQVPGSFFVGLNQVTFVPDDFLEPLTTYCIVIPSRREDILGPDLIEGTDDDGPGVMSLVRNTQGNPLFNRYSAFWITDDSFTFSNTLQSITPASETFPGTLGVDTDACVTVDYSQPLKSETISEGTFQVFDQALGRQVTGGTFSFPTPSSFTYCPPPDPNNWSDATIHRVTITQGIEDVDGIAVDGGVFWFTTAFPTPDGNTTLTETFADNTNEDPDANMNGNPNDDWDIRADWNDTLEYPGGDGNPIAPYLRDQLSPSGTPGQLVAVPGPIVGLGGDGSMPLELDTSQVHTIDTDNGTIAHGVGGGFQPTPVAPDGTPSFRGNGQFFFSDITIAGGDTLTAIGEWPLQLFADGPIDIAGKIDLHGEKPDPALAGPSESGGIPAPLRRGGGTQGGYGGSSNGTAGVAGTHGQLHIYPSPADPGQGRGCGGEAGIDSTTGFIFGSSGGGGGYVYSGFNGLGVTTGFLTFFSGNGDRFQCERSSGGSAIQLTNTLEPLYAGSGGGGGASSDDTPGGAGGNGGGSVALYANGPITVTGTIDCSGGPGGDVVPNGLVEPFLGGGGGGGSGGGILGASTVVVDMLSAKVDLSPGVGGMVPPPFWAFGGGSLNISGGHGTVGFIYLAGPVDAFGNILAFLPDPAVGGSITPIIGPDLRVNPPGLQPQVLGACATLVPTSAFPQATGVLAASYCARDVLSASFFWSGKNSIGLSGWMRITDNGLGPGTPVFNPDYTMVPLVILDDDNGTGSIQWQGAEDAGGGTPSPETITPWTTSDLLLDTHELLRFRVTFRTVRFAVSPAGPPPGGPPPLLPAVEDVSIDYSFNF